MVVPVFNRFLTDRKPKVDYVVSSLDLEGNIHILGCKLQDFCNGLKVCRPIGTKGIEYVFISPWTAPEFSPQNDSAQHWRRMFKINADSVSKNVIGLNLDGVIISVPSSCIAAAYRYALLRCTLNPAVTSGYDGNAVSKPTSLGLNQTFELLILVDPRNVVELIRPNRLLDLVKRIPPICGLSAYVYHLMVNDLQKCIEDFALTALKANRCIMDYNTAKLMQMLPRIPEKEVRGSQTSIRSSLRLERETAELLLEYTSKRIKLVERPRRLDVILWYLSRYIHVISYHRQGLCIFSASAVSEELLRTIERHTSMLLDFVSDQKQRAEIESAVARYLNEIEDRCYKEEKQTNQQLELYSQSWRKELAEKCNITSQRDIEARMRDAEDLPISICILNHAPLITKAISDNRHYSGDKLRIMIAI